MTLGCMLCAYNFKGTHPAKAKNTNCRMAPRQKALSGESGFRKPLLDPQLFQLAATTLPAAMLHIGGAQSYGRPQAPISVCHTALCRQKQPYLGICCYAGGKYGEDTSG